MLGFTKDFLELVKVYLVSHKNIELCDFLCLFVRRLKYIFEFYLISFIWDYIGFRIVPRTRINWEFLMNLELIEDKSKMDNE